jgi:hypothetical protein
MARRHLPLLVTFMKTIHVHIHRAPARDGVSEAYKGHLIKEDLSGNFHVSKGGQHITTQKSLAAAKKEIDGLTNDANMNPQISAAILAEKARNGGDLKAAFNKVLGQGAYEKLAGEIYAELRARAGIKDAGHYGDWEVISSFVLKNKKTGKTQSPYGSAPPDPQNWELVKVGYTVRNTRNGVVGIGRQPWATEAEAVAWAKSQQGKRAPSGHPGDKATADMTHAQAEKKCAAMLEKIKVAQAEIGKLGYSDEEMRKKTKLADSIDWMQGQIDMWRREARDGENPAKELAEARIRRSHEADLAKKRELDETIRALEQQVRAAKPRDRAVCACGAHGR